MKQLIKLYIKHSRVKKLNNYRYNQKVFENNFLNSLSSRASTEVPGSRSMIQVFNTVLCVLVFFKDL